MHLPWVFQHTSRPCEQCPISKLRQYLDQYSPRPGFLKNSTTIYSIPNEYNAPYSSENADRLMQSTWLLRSKSSTVARFPYSIIFSRGKPINRLWEFGNQPHLWIVQLKSDPKNTRHAWLPASRDIAVKKN